SATWPPADGICATVGLPVGVTPAWSGTSGGVRVAKGVTAKVGMGGAVAAGVGKVMVGRGGSDTSVGVAAGATAVGVGTDVAKVTGVVVGAGVATAVGTPNGEGVDCAAAGVAALSPRTNAVRRSSRDRTARARIKARLARSGFAPAGRPPV